MTILVLSLAPILSKVCLMKRKAVVAGLAALVIPVILPPSIYRLKAEPHPSLPSTKGLRDVGQEALKHLIAEVCLDCRVDGRLDFLRTKDFTPQQAFGRSFAYRQAPALLYS